MRVLTDGPTATEAVGTVLALDAHLTQEAERLAATGALEAAEAPATPEAAAAAREQVISAVAAVAETPIRSRQPCRARSKAPVASLMAVPIAAPLTAPAPVPASIAGLPQVDPAALDLAMKILSGQMRQLEITADMVGMTLAYQARSSWWARCLWSLWPPGLPQLPASGSSLSPRAWTTTGRGTPR